MRRSVPLLALLLMLVAAFGAGCGDDDDAAAGIDMTEIRDSLDAKLREEIALALYENPGSRADLLADVPTDEPELWAEINADGEITLEEFRSVRVVSNAVLTHTENVMVDFQERMVDAAEE